MNQQLVQQLRLEEKTLSETLQAVKTLLAHYEAQNSSQVEAIQTQPDTQPQADKEAVSGRWPTVFNHNHTNRQATFVVVRGNPGLDIDGVAKTLFALNGTKYESVENAKKIARNCLTYLLNDAKVIEAESKYVNGGTRYFYRAKAV